MSRNPLYPQPPYRHPEFEPAYLPHGVMPKTTHPRSSGTGDLPESPSPPKRPRQPSGQQRPSAPHRSEEQRPKKRLRIIPIVMVLFGCFCAPAVLFLMESSPVEEAASFLDKQEDQSSEWASWGFVPTSTSALPPDERQSAIAEELAGKLFPQFVLDEVLIVAGGYDEADDYYTADHYLMRLHLSEEPEVALAYEIWVGASDWIENDVKWSSENVDETEHLEVLEDGTEYVYDEASFIPLLEGEPPADYLDLLSVAATDWPGGVITWTSWYEDDTGDWAIVYPTKWDSFVDDAPFAGFTATYVSEATKGWVLDTWEEYEE